MKHYSREHERSLARVAELERRKTTCEAGVAAISACWVQLVEAIRLLARPEDLPPMDVKTTGLCSRICHTSLSECLNSTELFDMTAKVYGDPQPALVSALEDNMHATKELVTKFVQLGASTQSAVLRDETYVKCQTLQTECATLKAQVALLQTQLGASESQRDSFHAELIAAEMRAARLQSSTVLDMQARAVDKQDAKTGDTEEPQRKLSSSPAQSPVVPNEQSGTPDWQPLARHRLKEVKDLEQKLLHVLMEKNALLLECRAPSLEYVKGLPYYKVLLEHASQLEHTLKEKQEQIERLEEEVDRFHSTRKEFEESAVVSVHSILLISAKVANPVGSITGKPGAQKSPSQTGH
jgi:E3 ubiquitin-protein ligase BRE1